MKYQYGDIEDAQVGDVVEYAKTPSHNSKWKTTKGNLYIVQSGGNPYSFIDDKGKQSDGLNMKSNSPWKLVKTKPGSKAKVGDKVVCTKDVPGLIARPGEVYTNSKEGDSIYPKEAKEYSWNPAYFRVLCTEPEESAKPKAYYKRSGEPWTLEELQRIPNYWDQPYVEYNKHRKFIYPDVCGNMFTWGLQHPHKNIQKYQQIAYEDAFTKTLENKVYDKYAIETESFSEPTNQPTKENTMNDTLLKLLVELMTAPEKQDATNSKYVGIMTDANNQYLGYVYFNDKSEAEDIVARPENEGCTLHTFKYKTSLTQKPREVIEVERT